MNYKLITAVIAFFGMIGGGGGYGWMLNGQLSEARDKLHQMAALVEKATAAPEVKPQACPAPAPVVAPEAPVCEPKVITKTVVKSATCAPQPPKTPPSLICQIFGGG
jgi:hypothetical protein